MFVGIEQGIAHGPDSIAIGPPSKAGRRARFYDGLLCAVQSWLALRPGARAARSSWSPYGKHLSPRGQWPHPVLVLPGWFGDAHAFEPIEAWLDGGAFSYVFMDYRGYGGMRDAPGDYTIDEIATDALALADELGFASFSLIGHSMGGMAIERIAALAPERVRALVAVAPVPCGGIRMDAARRALFEGAAVQVEQRRTIIDRSTGGRLPASWVAWKAAYSAARSMPAAFAPIFAPGPTRISAMRSTAGIR